MTMSENRTKTVVLDCLSCGKEVVLKVNPKDWEEYLSPNRRHVQDIFPYLTPAEREMFISKMCPECWEDLFDDDYEDISPEDLYEWMNASCGLV